MARTNTRSRSANCLWAFALKSNWAIWIIGLISNLYLALHGKISTESIREGGQLYDYALPTKMQYGELVLKRGLWVTGTEGKDEFHKWLDLHSTELKVYPKDIIVMLIRPWDTNTVYYTWNIKHAWPKKWSISDFNAEENQVVIETLELHYDSFTVV
jgi:phage tail-like protein